MTSTHEGDITIPHLPHAACRAHLFKELKHGSGSLISLGQLCDSGCTATFTNTTVKVYYNAQCIITGYRTPQTGLWHIPIDNPPGFPPIDPIQQAASVTIKPTHNFANAAHFDPTKAQQVAFSHATMGHPALSTLQTAVDKHYITGFPGLNTKSLRKYPPQSKATTKGHMDQQRQGTKTTKPKLPQPVTDSPTEFPPALPKGQRTQACFATMIARDPTGQIYTDQTGQLPITSSQGMQYIFVLYSYDPNYIHMEPMKNRTAGEILSAFKRSNAVLVQAGFKPALHRLDNECSNILKEHLRSENIDFQLAPPGMHRRNAAERAIRTAKNHLIAIFCGCDPNFPMHLWCRLIPQANITLNLLRGSRVNPKLSAYAQVHGIFDFNRTPMAPPGTFVLGHEKPGNRASWDPHAKEAWYVGPAMDSYRCYQAWCIDTRATRIMDTVEWFPRHVTMPTHSTTDIVIKAANDLTNALANPSPNSPLAPLTDSEVHQLETIQQILHNRVPTVPQTPPLQRVPQKTPWILRDPIKPTQRDPDWKDRIATKHHHRKLPTRNQKAHAARKQSAATRKAIANTRKSTAQHKITTDPFKAPRSKRKKRNKPAAIALKQLLSHRLERLFPQPSPFNAPQVCNAVNIDTGREASYQELRRNSEGDIWEQMFSDEIGRCCQGNDAHPDSGTNTCYFITKDQVPHNKKPTYARLVPEDRPHKVVKKRVRWTVGGNRIEYDGEVSTKTSDLTTVKCLLNSVISTPDAKFCTADIKDFYLNTPMTEYEYMRLRVDDIPADIMRRYDLDSKIHNGYIYVEIRKGMYGLPQAGRLANDRLVKFLAQNGYHQTKHTHGLFKHTTRPIMFTLVVDDFGIQYTGEEHAQHLIDTIQAQYTMTTDWTGSLYCGLTLNWDYTNRTVDLSMPGYITKALARFEHPHPNRAQNSPYKCNLPQYGAKTQLTAKADTTNPLQQKDTKRLQEIIGTLLYYGRAVDSTMLVALGTLASAQTKGTQATKRAAAQLLDYCFTHPDATVRYHASGMILSIHSDASYHSETEARSRVAGHFILSDSLQQPNTAPKPADKLPPHNGAILIISSILPMVLASATEAELAALYYNAREACTIRTTLDEMGHPQPATPIQTDNEVAVGLALNTVKQRRSKAIDMRFYWIRDRIQQGQFLVYWRPGKENDADYFSKHHPTAHHILKRARYLQPIPE